MDTHKKGPLRSGPFLLLQVRCLISRGADRGRRLRAAHHHHAVHRRHVVHYWPDARPVGDTTVPPRDIAVLLPVDTQSTVFAFAPYAPCSSRG